MKWLKDLVRKLAKAVRDASAPVAVTACLAACAHNPPPPDPNAATCADVCAHGAEMSCVWATPTPLGSTCVQVCENAAKFTPWNLECLVLADDCGPRVCP